jgi:recombination protein RecT
MRVKDIEKIRNASKSKDNGPWVDWTEEMAKKSVFKRLAKRLPVSREIAQVVSRDDFLYDLNNIRDVTPAADRPKGLTNRLDALVDNRGVGTVPAMEDERDLVPAENAGRPVDDDAGQQSSAGTQSDDAAAFRAGRQARASGMSRKAIPQEYKRDKDLADAWLEGFDAEGGEA